MREAAYSKRCVIEEAVLARGAGACAPTMKLAEIAALAAENPSLFAPTRQVASLPYMFPRSLDLHLDATHR
eukprot:1366030-Pleurochrysis_carterae.AAC.2